MRRHVYAAVGLACAIAVLAVLGTKPTLAQGILKPLAALIVNDTAHPVPVTVVPSPATTLVLCSMQLGQASNVGPIAQGGGGGGIGSLQCPAGVSKIDVLRVSFNPDMGSFGTSLHAVHYRASFWI